MWWTFFPVSLSWQQIREMPGPVVVLWLVDRERVAEWRERVCALRTATGLPACVCGKVVDLLAPTGTYGEPMGTGNDPDA